MYNYLGSNDNHREAGSLWIKLLQKCAHSRPQSENLFGPAQILTGKPFEVSEFSPARISANVAHFNLDTLTQLAIADRTKSTSRICFKQISFSVHRKSFHLSNKISTGSCGDEVKS